DSIPAPPRAWSALLVWASLVALQGLAAPAPPLKVRSRRGDDRRAGVAAASLAREASCGGRAGGWAALGRLCRCRARGFAARGWPFAVWRGPFAARTWPCARRT